MAIAGALAFSPFAILAAQSYGGEAIYRVFLFSCPWCALLIAGALCELRLPLRWLLVAGVSGLVLAAGLQGLYGPVEANAYTSAEVNASLWLYSHVPRGSLIVLPVENFPILETANYNHYDVQVMPADPQIGSAWMDEGNVLQVENWITSLHQRVGYVVVAAAWMPGSAITARRRDIRPRARAPDRAARQGGVPQQDTTIYRLNIAGNVPSSPPPARHTVTDTVCATSCPALRWLLPEPPASLRSGSATPPAAPLAPLDPFAPPTRTGAQRA